MTRSCVLRFGIGGIGLLAALSSCGSSGGDEFGPPLPSLLFNTSVLGPIGGDYDGPAVVERSTARELVLAFDADPATGGTLPRHATIQGVGSALFPVGAQVWLKKKPVLEVPSFGMPARPASFSVLTQQNGTLLLGVASSSDASSLVETGLFPLREKGMSRGSYRDKCASGTLETTTFEVQGDATVTIGDGATRGARLGGVDYDLGLVARRFDFAPSSATCSDYSPYSWFQLSVRAHDLAARVSTLPVGESPACGLGNADLKDIVVWLYNVPSGVAYDGPAFYTKRGALEGFDCFQFRVAGLAAEPGLPPPVVEACVPPGALPEPAVGEEFWATIPTIALATLRRANRGDLVAASFVTSTEGASSSQVSQALGMPIDVHPGCAYADYNVAGTDALMIYRLQEVAFGASGPVVVGSQGHAVVSIGGVDCDVWVWDSGALTILAR